MWLIVGAIGALVLLTLSAVVVQRTSPLSRQVAARVNGREITRQDLAAEERAQGRLVASTPALDVLEAVIARELLAQEAQRRGFTRSPNYPSDRKRADQQVLVNALLKSLPRPPAPSAAQVAGFIADHPDAFDRRRRYTLEELRFDVLAAPDLEGLPIDEARSQLQARRIGFEETQVVLIGSEAPPPLRRALITAQEGDEIGSRVGGAATRLQVVSADAAPITGVAAQAAAAAALDRAQRERQVSMLLHTLRQNAQLRLSQDERVGARPVGVPH